MKKLWVFGTSHSAGSCQIKDESISRFFGPPSKKHQFLVNPYPKLIHNETEYSVKNFAIPGIDHDMQLFFIATLVGLVKERPDVIIIEHRSLFEKTWPAFFDSIFNTISRDPTTPDGPEGFGIIARYFSTLCEHVAIRSDVKNDIYFWFYSIYNTLSELQQLINSNSSLFLSDKMYLGLKDISAKNSINYREATKLLNTLGINYEKKWLTHEQWIEFVRFYSMNIHCNSIDAFKKIMDFIGIINFLKNLGIKVKWLTIDPMQSTRCYLRNLQNKLVEDAVLEDCIYPYSKHPDNQDEKYFEYNEKLVNQLEDKSFLCDCGHPNDKAHRIFANIIKNEL